MGHSEMLLAVAGLKDEQIKDRTRKLASGDWNGFRPAEQLSFRLAYRMAKAPWEIPEDEIRELKDFLGEARALDLIWHGGWCNYMTRIADAFQLPLERTNIFAPPSK